MSRIILDTSKMKLWEGFGEICEYAGLDDAWADQLWQDIVVSDALYEELVYYIGHHTFLDRLKVAGYSLCDLYVFQMNKYNLLQETGKNSRSCNKEKMVMKAFRTMADMMKDPEEYVKRLTEGRGMDKL